MFMPCPHCGYVVALIVSQHGPSQRCTRCDGALLAEPPAPAGSMDIAADARAAPGDPVAATETDHVQGESPSAASISVADAGAGSSLAEPGADATTATPAAPVTMPSAVRRGSARRPPSFVRGNAPSARSRLAWPWHAAIVALGLLLGLQLLLAQRHELAASARWRPWVEGLCNTLPCEIPAWREPHAFTMLERSVQPHPAMPGVLAVEVNFRNDARWPQPWPMLVLSLSDVEGRQVGLRVFAPSEYRESGAGSEGLLAPGQIAAVRLQVREPSPRIVAFTFDFQ